jgi:hypothetical protein
MIATPTLDVVLGSDASSSKGNKTLGGQNVWLKSPKAVVFYFSVVFFSAGFDRNGNRQN